MIAIPSSKMESLHETRRMSKIFSVSQSQEADSKIRKTKLYYDHITHDSLSVLHYFCRCGCKSIADVEAVIQIDPELVSLPTPAGGNIPLHFAVGANDIRTTKLLLKSNPSTALMKSNRDSSLGNQMIALHIALTLNCSVEIIHALVEACPKSVKVRDGYGRSAQELLMEYYSDQNSTSTILALLNKYS